MPEIGPLQRASLRADKRIVKARERANLIANDDAGSVFTEADVAEELGVEAEELETLLAMQGDVAVRALTKGHALPEQIIKGALAQMLLVGQELGSENKYTREQLLRCLTGSGADAYTWLAELIGAEDHETDAAKEE